MSISEIQTLMQRFQDGYTQRDAANLDAFMALFTDDENLEVIGTNAVLQGVGEWCLGTEAVRKLIKSDWEHWGDVVFNLEKMRIHLHGDTSWLATTGTVTDVVPVDQRFHGYLDYVRHVLEKKSLRAEEKTLDIVQMGNDIVLDLTRDEKYVWPLRFTAVAVKRDGAWKFSQMTFSFATTRAPDVRL